MDDLIAKAILDKLDEISLWMKFSCKDSLREAVKSILKYEKDFIIYEMTDGINSTTEISKKANCSQPTVSNVWNRWKKIGIVTEVANVQGRCRVLCSLEELGITPNDIKQNIKE